VAIKKTKRANARPDEAARDHHRAPTRLPANFITSRSCPTAEYLISVIATDVVAGLAPSERGHAGIGHNKVGSIDHGRFSEKSVAEIFASSA
jgi:hypothetical protein